MEEQRQLAGLLKKSDKCDCGGGMLIWWRTPEFAAQNETLNEIKIEYNAVILANRGDNFTVHVRSVR
jgi:hypothetical protein